MQDCSLSFTRLTFITQSIFSHFIYQKPPFHPQNTPFLSSPKSSTKGPFTTKGRRMNAWNRIKGFFNNNDENDSSNPPPSHPNEGYHTSSYPGLDQISMGYTQSASPSRYYVADTYPTLDNIPESGVYNGLYQNIEQGGPSTQTVYPNMAPEPVESEVIRPSFDGIGDILAACNLNTPKKPGENLYGWPPLHTGPQFSTPVSLEKYESEDFTGYFNKGFVFTSRKN